MDQMLHLTHGFGGGTASLALMASLLLGLRHAMDPDHLIAVSSLVLGGDSSSTSFRGESPVPAGPRRAAYVGGVWGLGHAFALLALGSPLILLGLQLPAPLQLGAEIMVGILIVFLAIRLLSRWWRSRGTAHAHGQGSSDARELVHVHVPSPGPESVETHVEHQGQHVVTEPVEYSRSAFGIGLVHGVGGSAPIGLLLVASAPGKVEALFALSLFAGGSTLAMAALSSTLGVLIGNQAVQSRFQHVMVMVGVGSLAFGMWYALSAARGL